MNGWLGLRLAVAGALLATAWVAQPAAAQRASDDAVRRLLIEESHAGYPGNCPCPYSRMRNGRPCGEHSAYSKPGGRSPLCYPREVTPGMVDDYRRRKGQAN